MKIRALVGASAALLALACLAPAARAQAPFGTWYGRYSDGSGAFSLVIQGNGSGGFSITDRRGRVLRAFTGVWTMIPNSTGGVLTMNYRQVGFVNKIHFGFQWRRDGSIVLTDYYTQIGRVSVVLYRR
jgi:hypothetical protein